MKLCDWYNFNFDNEQFKCNIGDVYVKVFRKESYDKKDMIFEQLMDPIDMVNLFGDYKIFLLNKSAQDGYCTMCVCIYKENYIFKKD